MINFFFLPTLCITHFWVLILISSWCRNIPLCLYVQIINLCGFYTSSVLPPHLISCNCDEVHGVIDSFQNAQNRCQRLLQVISPLTALTVLQHFLWSETQRRGLQQRKKPRRHFCWICVCSEIHFYLQQQLIFGNPLNWLEQIWI